MKIFYNMLLVLLPALFISCSEDSPNQPDDNNSGSIILPATAGNYWIYESYALDASYNRTSKSKGLDSIIVTGTALKLGKTAAVFTTYSTDSTGMYKKSKDDYYYNEKSRLYVHSDYLTSLMPSFAANFIKLDEQWLLIADENDNDWTVMEQKIDTVNLLVAKIYGNLLIRGKKSIEKQVSVGNSNYTAREYILNGEFDGFVIMGDYTVPVDFNTKISLYFVKGIGLAGSITDISEIVTPIGNTPREITESSLIKYQVGK